MTLKWKRIEIDRETHREICYEKAGLRLCPVYTKIPLNYRKKRLRPVTWYCEPKMGGPVLFSIRLLSEAKFKADALIASRNKTSI